MSRRILLVVFGVLLMFALFPPAAVQAQAPAKKPNILVIMGDDMFPVRQKPASFNLDEVMQKLNPPGS